MKIDSEFLLLLIMVEFMYFTFSNGHVHSYATYDTKKSKEVLEQEIFECENMNSYLLSSNDKHENHHALFIAA